MTHTTTPQAIPSTSKYQTEHDPTHFIKLEFQEGRDRDSLKPVVGYLGVGHRGDDVLFGEVFNAQIDLAQFTMRSYRVDEYLALDKIREEGLTLDAGNSRNMVFVPADQIALALDNLPNPKQPGFSLSGAGIPEQAQRAPAPPRFATTVAHTVEVEFLEGPHAQALQPRRGLLGVGRHNEDQLDPYGQQGAMIVGEVIEESPGVQTFSGHSILSRRAFPVDFAGNSNLSFGAQGAGDSERVLWISGAERARVMPLLPDLDHPGKSLTGADLLAASAAKDRYDLAYEALDEQRATLDTTVSQWNSHNDAVKPKIEAYSKMVTDVDTFLATALDKAGGDREKTAALFVQTSEKLEPHLVKAGARKPEVPQFVAPASRTPDYEPTSLRPARDTSLDNVEPVF